MPFEIKEENERNFVKIGPTGGALQNSTIARVITEVDALPSRSENALPGITDAPPSYDEVMASSISQNHDLPKVD